MRANPFIQNKKSVSSKCLREILARYKLNKEKIHKIKIKTKTET
jgi:hypothetical protein